MNHPKIRHDAEVSALRLEPGECITVFLSRASEKCDGCRSERKRAPVQVELHVTAEGKPRVVLAEADEDCLTTYEEAYPEQYTAKASPSSGDARKDGG